MTAFGPGQDCIRLHIGLMMPLLNFFGLWPKVAPREVLISLVWLRTALLGIRLSDCNNRNLKDLKKDDYKSGKQLIRSSLLDLFSHWNSLLVLLVVLNLYVCIAVYSSSLTELCLVSL
ncbi:uncharacterized protein LY79DRAFT_183666 [Colletotrichum navitas]|uniref:Uncharacterized protein n=1 Tax=Colletotrichum navitas TaxID=681940 RepID=A0AAD8V6G2_9PEZI|nr:uncharacterized protein LY79DRAFT_183666 [Colletotrichum navitas]KAK1593300.1 hypothetical protein LY79DRAFT_183666 [Colletotrichum navitas]